ncbi:MAG: hypothetical protein Q9162_007232 [Coniocarpon cinnabarinum]
MSATKRKDGLQNSQTRPLMPRLAASAQSPRPHPAPKLANYTSTPPVKRATTSQTTPTLTSPRHLGEEKITPVSHFVNANVTPRSSSRRSRAGSFQSSPVNETSDTPSKWRPLSTQGLGSRLHANTIDGLEAHTSQYGPGKPLQNKLQSVPMDVHRSQSPDSIDAESRRPEEADRFFYASEGPVVERIAPKVQHKKNDSFVYADGATENPGKSHPAAIAQGDKSLDTSISTTSSALRNGQSKAHSASSLKATYAATPPSVQSPRQPSPPRQAFHLTYRKGASQIMPPQPVSPSLPEYDPTRRRQPSIDDEQAKRQSRNKSVSSIGSTDLLSRQDSGFPFLSLFSMPSSRNSPMHSPTADSTMRSSGDRDNFQTMAPDLERTQSPPSAVGSAGSDQQKAEAAAYARRERKIMDLEISNSSLLVINKSLEKEIRKQKAELRRFRRLSRKTSLEAIRLSSGQHSVTTENDEEGEEEVSEDADSDSEDSQSEDESLFEEPMSPGAVTQKDARHRNRDRIRLKKDLAKHKELLADSSRMNQSLKKCMGITEALIKEGSKALEYKVDYEDVRLGGRILSPDDLPEFGDEI